MNPLCDATHSPSLRSWLESANQPGGDFPIQNLPLGRFSRRGVDEPLRAGVAIGNQVLDLKLAAGQCPWPDDIHTLLEPLASGDLAAFMALGPLAWKALRGALSAALAEGSEQAPFLEDCLVAQAQVQMAMPCPIGDYTDFYAGIHHARRVGSLQRPDNPLLPNYKWLPIGYHGRASSVGLGGPVVRPNGQSLVSKKDEPAVPVFGPTQRLDYELELGLWVGVGNPQGQPVAMVQAEERLFGISLLNDWSARDVQAWEYQPLGPFLGKSFATSVSPWLVSFEALAPFRRAFTRPADDPPPLAYLDSDRNRASGAIDITLQVWLLTPQMQAQGQPAVMLSQSNALDAYWTPAQLLAHHTSNGCNLQTGDLLGTGTLSGPLPGQGGCLLELTQAGRVPLVLPSGEQRRFLEDGDTLTLRAFCEAPGAVRIGLGQVTGTVLPAR
jgi:fumarylacetoacetase